MSREDRSARVRAVVCGVIAQTLVDAGAAGLLVLEDSTPEGRLLVEWATASLGPEHVHSGPADTAETWVQAVGPRPDVTREVRRAAARVHAAERNLLLAHPVNKTALLLSREPPPERLLPLADLYASQILELAGACTLTADAEAMAAAAGGLAAIDAVLAGWLEGRRDLESAMASLGPEARIMIRTELHRNRSVRRWPRIVPKLGSRTLWVDLCA